MALGMYHPCLNGKDTSKPVASHQRPGFVRGGLRTLYSSPPATQQGYPMSGESSDAAVEQHAKA